MTASHTSSAASDEENILFVFGSARGGTTFLSKVLTEWLSFGMGPEGTFIQQIVARAEQLGDLSNDDHCLDLAREIIATPVFQIIEQRWDKEAFSVRPEEIMALMPQRDAASAIFAAFKVMALKLGKTRVGNKNPGYWRELATLHRLFPDRGRYLFIVRDGRDVALSLKDVPWGGHSVYEAASIWRNMVTTVNEFGAQLAPNRLLCIRYEDLLGRPGESIEAIGTFVAEDNLQSLRQEYEQAAAENSLQSNYGKWRDTMAPAEQRVYEAVAGQELESLGYERLFPEAKLSVLETLGFKAQVLLRKVRANLYHLQSKLPLDARQSNKGLLARLFQPGNSSKRD